MGDEARLSEDETGEVTCAEAREIAARYNASHWHPRRGDGYERARYSIPADPRRDDDIRLGAFIDQAERDRATLAAKDEEIAALRVERDRWQEAAHVYEKAASGNGRDALERGADLARLRAREERTAAVIEALIAAGEGMRRESWSMIPVDAWNAARDAAFAALDATPEHARGVSEEDGSTAVLAASVALWERTDGCDPRWIRAVQEDGAEDALRAWRDAVQAMIERARPDQRSDAAEREGVKRGE